MAEGDSLRPYIEAARRYPEAVSPGRGSQDETLPASDSPRPSRPTTTAVGPDSGDSSGALGGQGTAKPGERAEAWPFPPKYEKIEQIAETQLSRTWKALDHERGTHVVIKEPRTAVLLDVDALDRFRREVQLASKFVHRNIVPILATYLAEPPYFYTMPFIEGEHLDEFCARRKLSLRARLNLFQKVCRAVVHAHQQGVIHRDLKPNNILVDETGEPQLFDFGLGQVYEPGQPVEATERGAIFGAPGYMSPEQAAGLPGDVRSDVYSLGVILFQLLTGKLPIDPTRRIDELARRIREMRPVRPREIVPKFNWELEAILLKALNKDPAERYQSVSEFAGDVDSWLHDRPTSVGPQTLTYRLLRWLRRNRYAVAAGSVLMAGLVGFTTFAVMMSFRNSRSEARAAERVAEAAETMRHRIAIRLGRSLTQGNNPVDADRVLWAEHLDDRHSDRQRTAYALWELYRRYPCAYTVGGYGRLTRVQYTPDSRWLVAVQRDGPEDGRLLVFEAATGRPAAVVPVEQAHAIRVTFAHRSSDLYVSGTDGCIRVWPFPAADGRLGAQTPVALNLATEPITALALSADDAWLAVGTERGEVSVWNLTDPTEPRGAYAWRESRAICNLAFSDDGARLAGTVYPSNGETPGLRTGVVVWDLKGGREEAFLAVSEGCRAVFWLPATEQLLFGSRKLCAWDLTTRVRTELAPDEFRWGIRSLDLLQNSRGSLLTMADGNGEIGFFDPVRRTLCSVRGFHDDVFADHVDVCFSPDGRFAASVGRDGLRVWDIGPALGIQLAQLDEPGWEIRARDISPDMALVAAVGSRRLEAAEAGPATTEGTARQTESPAAHQLTRLLIYDRSNPAGPVTAQAPQDVRSIRVAIGANSRTVAIAHGVHSRLTRVVISGLPEASKEGTSFDVADLVRAMCWLDAQCRMLLVGRDDGRVEAWRIQGVNAVCDGELAPPEGPVGQVSRITVSEDGRWVVVCWEGSDGPGQVGVWRANGRNPVEDGFDQAYEHVRTLATADHETRCDYAWCGAVLEPVRDRPLLASVGNLREVLLWDLRTGRLCGKLTGHRDGIDHCAAVSDRILVTSSRDKRVLLWDVLEQEELCVLYEARAECPLIRVHDGRIAILDGDRVTIADTRDIQRFIDGNRAYEEQRLATARRDE